jgi:hypothetical protein
MTPLAAETEPRGPLGPGSPLSSFYPGPFFFSPHARRRRLRGDAARCWFSRHWAHSARRAAGEDPSPQRVPSALAVLFALCVAQPTADHRIVAPPPVAADVPKAWASACTSWRRRVSARFNRSAARHGPSQASVRLTEAAHRSQTFDMMWSLSAIAKVAAALAARSEPARLRGVVLSFGAAPPACGGGTVPPTHAELSAGSSA